MILISGDSWSAGVWHKDNDIPEDKGISFYLRNHEHKVLNLTKPGGSNLESIDRIRDYFRCNQSEISNVKFILFWKTEFFREIWYYRTKSIITSELHKELSYGYRQMRDQWVYRPYYRLAELSQQWNVPIYVIGGCSDTVWYDDFEIDFPGVKIICQSMTNLLLNNNHRIDQPVFCGFLPTWINEGDFLNIVRKNISNDDYQELLQDMEIGMKRHEEYKNHPELFYPDGVHPNKKSHEILFNFILNKIPELNSTKGA